jgi:hypothetical protein
VEQADVYNCHGIFSIAASIAVVGWGPWRVHEAAIANAVTGFEETPAT